VAKGQVVHRTALLLMATSHHYQEQQQVCWQQAQQQELRALQQVPARLVRGLQVASLVVSAYKSLSSLLLLAQCCQRQHTGSM
jgi:hypothetical protein